MYSPSQTHGMVYSELSRLQIELNYWWGGNQKGKKIVALKPWAITSSFAYAYIVLTVEESTINSSVLAEGRW